MRIRYPLLTLLTLAGAMAAPLLFGSFWLLLAGLWLACVPGLMSILDFEASPSAPTAQLLLGEFTRDAAPSRDQFPAAA